MIVYIDHAFERRRRAGKIRDLDDIIWAHMEGTVQRVRPEADDRRHDAHRPRPAALGDRLAAPT